MATRTSLTTVADGDQLNEGYYNGMLAATNRLLASNETPASITSTSYTDVLTAAVAAGACTDHVVIVCDWNAYASGASNTTSLQLVIDSTTKITKTVVTSGTDFTGARNGGTFLYYYEPSSGEKSAGFTVKIQAKDVGGGTNSFTGNRLWVLGA